MDAYVLSVVTSGTAGERLNTWFALYIGDQSKTALWPRYNALLLAKSKLCAEYTEASSFAKFIFAYDSREAMMVPVNRNQFHHASILEFESEEQRVIVLERGIRTVLREILR